MEDKPDKTKEVTDSLIEKSKILRAKAKDAENKLNELKAKVEEFIHAEKDTDKNK